MRTGVVISSVGHAVALLWGLITFNAAPLDAPRQESMPVDIVTPSEFSEVMKGVQSAPKAEEPKPLADKQGEVKPPKETTPKVSEKPEIVTSSAQPPPAAAEKPDKPEKKKEPEPKADPIAEALKKDDAQKKAEIKTPLPPKRPTPSQPPQPKFDAAKVAALLDKRNPQRQAATGPVPESAPALGAEAGESARLSQSELDALRARLMQLWNPPIGIRNAEDMIIKVRVRFNPDGRLASPPLVVTSGSGPLFNSARDSAIRALYRGQPFDMLRKETYDAWKDVEITFDPRDMFRG
jgi:colicin import membrane protein